MQRQYSNLKIKCNFEGRLYPVDFTVGMPKIHHHPLYFQSKWLMEERGGEIPTEVMDALEMLYQLAIKYKVTLADLSEEIKK